MIKGTFGPLTGFMAIAPYAVIASTLLSIPAILGQVEDEPSEQLGLALQQISNQLNIIYEHQNYWLPLINKNMLAGFEFTFEKLKVMQEALLSGMQYLEHSNNEKFKVLERQLNEILGHLIKIGQENLLSSLKQAISKIELDKVLPEAELVQVLNVIEFYLYSQSTNPAFTYARTGTLNPHLLETDFTAEQVEESLLNKDPFNKVGYLEHYRTLSEKVQIANPYVWLLAAKAYIMALRFNSDSPVVQRISQEKINKLLKPAQAIQALFVGSRDVNYRRQLLLNYETNLNAARTYIREKLNLFNKNNTILSIDIHGNLTSLLSTAAHRQDLLPVNTTAIIQSTNAEKINVDQWRFVLSSMKVNISDSYSKMAELGSRIPSEYMLADKVHHGTVKANFYIGYEYYNGNIHYHFKVFYTNRNSHPADIYSFTKLGYCHDSALDHHAYYYGEKQTATGVLQEKYHSSNFHGPINKLYSDAALAELRQELNQVIFENPKRNFAKELLNPLHPSYFVFQSLLLDLNKSYIWLMAFLKLSGSKVEVSQHFYTGYSIQQFLTLQMESGNLTELDNFLDGHYHSDYENFKSRLLHESEFPDTQVQSDVELLLDATIRELNTTYHLAKMQANLRGLPLQNLLHNLEKQYEDLLQQYQSSQHSFVEIASESAIQGARMGVMRGAANVIGGKNSWRATGLFYGGYYLSRLYDSYQQKPNQNYWDAMYQAGGDTLWFAGTELAVSQASRGLKFVGDSLQKMKKTSAQLVGKVTSKLANVVGYSVYAYEGIVAWQTSPVPLKTVSQLAARVFANMTSGYVAQQATEKVGTAICNAVRFFKGSKQTSVVSNKRVESYDHQRRADVRRKR